MSTFHQACLPVIFAEHRAWCYAALAPAKDMELVLHARSLACPALAALLFAALRALIDGLGATAFNVAALRMAPDGAPSAAGSPIVVRRARGCQRVMVKRQAGAQNPLIDGLRVVQFRSAGLGKPCLCAGRRWASRSNRAHKPQQRWLMKRLP